MRPRFTKRAKGSINKANTGRNPGWLPMLSQILFIDGSYKLRGCLNFIPFFNRPVL
jgi:hypothetical protein